MRLYADGFNKHLSFGELMRREAIVTSLGETRLTDSALDDLLVASKDDSVHEEIDAQVSILLSAIETLRDLFDPEVILLGGYLGSLVKCRKSQIDAALNGTSLKYRDENFLVSRAAELKPMVILGAAELVWADVLDDPQSYGVNRNG
jgi:predicted NBD/HSP70 family sugar kinase